jgi:SAM-dependent methyltransferase
MSDHGIIDWPAWTNSPPGRYVLDWEQAQLDHVVGDIFGYHALQLGLPQVDALRENRMPYRGLVLDSASRATAPFVMPPIRSPRGVGADMGAHSGSRVDGAFNPPADARDCRDAPSDGRIDSRGSVTSLPGRNVAHSPAFSRSTIWCEFVELPFEAQSVDLIVLPHTLEFSPDPHRLLREVERVLMPDGRLVISGFNSLSLWGMRQSMGRMTRRPFVPGTHDLIAFTRLKDWIKLLGFEFDRGRFGCYRPPLLTDKWLARYEFMESAGDRWWPIFGATYMITAVKRVRGMRMVGPKWAKKPALAPGLAPVATPNSRTTTIERKIQQN